MSRICECTPQVLCITAAVALASWLAVGGCLLAAAPAVPFLAALERPELWAVASLGGTLAMARSPASAVSRLQQLSAGFVTEFPYHIRSGEATLLHGAALPARPR